MEKDVQRIGIGNNRYPNVNESIGLDEAGYFTFDSTTVRFDSVLDTFDFDIIPIPPVVVRDYSATDYSTTDYK
ncbi:hypothetical protein [Flavobacterium sp. WC2509]|uniref:hypothetical protein n=1 Tax=Flavobacterium sp. WC2509 TaxID=3461406 RepID=UPI0040443933